MRRQHPGRQIDDCCIKVVLKMLKGGRSRNWHGAFVLRKGPGKRQLLTGCVIGDRGDLKAVKVGRHEAMPHRPICNGWVIILIKF